MMLSAVPCYPFSRTDEKLLKKVWVWMWYEPVEGFNRDGFEQASSRIGLVRKEAFDVFPILVP